ncbi:ATP-grasp domain-containing protein [Aerococcaceae bacterium WS4759]|uniref:ATP-grasp domain-containing protein n=1 Tax=Fundicoccus ignavus TaxID=2664442 RepID=A0A6I2GH99_9LACT|nr:ATP-grasp domain-containing protein [Fundicoccus ignavus]MRI84629.1 ATP-grasp domain-containing protein [Fundicoccus ignavus]
MTTNILILSVGTRNKIIQYFKHELKGKGKIIVTDSSELAPALYEADKHYIVPRITEPGYIETILEICTKEKITGILSLIDPELTLLAENYSKFTEIGVTPIISRADLVTMSFNKFEFNKFVQRLGFNSIKSYKELSKFYEDLDNNKISFPVFVKPITGSASINISKVKTKEQLEEMFERFDDLLIQELMDEKEYGVDVYIDLLSSEPVSLFIKEKLNMRAGETDKSISVRNEKLFNLVYDFVTKAGYRGIIDIDIFEKQGEFYISEVNPRFGGGYPHAFESGINVPLQIINNLQNHTNTPNLDYAPGIYMMKFNEVTIKRID